MKEFESNCDKGEAEDWVMRRSKAEESGGGVGHYKDCVRLANGSLWLPHVLRWAGWLAESVTTGNCTSPLCAPFGWRPTQCDCLPRWSKPLKRHKTNRLNSHSSLLRTRATSHAAVLTVPLGDSMCTLKLHQVLPIQKSLTTQTSTAICNVQK